MDYRLMHKNIPVMKFTLDDITCSIMRIGEIYNKDHIPIGIPYKLSGIEDEFRKIVGDSLFVDTGRVNANS